MCLAILHVSHFVRAYPGVGFGAGIEAVLPQQPPDYLDESPKAISDPPQYSWSWSH